MNFRYKADPNVDKGGGSKNPKIWRTSFLEAPKHLSSPAQYWPIQAEKSGAVAVSLPSTSV